MYESAPHLPAHLLTSHSRLQLARAPLLRAECTVRPTAPRDTKERASQPLAQRTGPERQREHPHHREPHTE